MSRITATAHVAGTSGLLCPVWAAHELARDVADHVRFQCSQDELVDGNPCRVG